jgi:CRISPR/Cas system-associated exonuclease Cas4 (RecB family)
MSRTARKSSEHWSNTQIDMLFRCPEAYRRRYVEGERCPPGLAMLRGTGVHSAARVNFSQKITTHCDLPPKQIVDAAVAAFDEQIAAGDLALDDDERSRGLKIVVGETRDDVADIADVHAHEQAPAYQPTHVEHSINVELPGSRSLLAIIDLADTLDRVVDFKTAKRSKSQKDADDSTQLSIYEVAFEAETGRKATELVLDTVVQLKRETKRQTLTTQRTAVDRAVLAERIDVAARMVEAGIFPPAAAGVWNCSKKWCGYYRTCRFVNGNRADAAQGD